jgi:hypothetical protein
MRSSWNITKGEEVMGINTHYYTAYGVKVDDYDTEFSAACDEVYDDIIKSRVNTPAQNTIFTWNPVHRSEREKIKPKFTYRRGHPAGYTDDLGIIADRNQWVDAVTGGYHSEVDPQDYQEIREWCDSESKAR